MSWSITSGWPNKDTLSASDPGSEAKSGDGGPVLSVWTADRQTKLRDLVGAPYTNESSFTVPAGFVDTGGWPVSFENQERKLGVNVEGNMLNADGKPLSGEAIVEASGQVFESSTVSGTFLVSSQPPVGTYLGPDTAGDEFDFRFRPSINGISYFEGNIPFQFNSGTIQYGEIFGTISDYDGEPVPNIAVGGQGAADVTDEQGAYVLVAPGGSTVDLRTLYDTYTFSVTLGAGERKTQDVTFPKLTIRVLDADFQPVENAPVKIDGTTHYTGADGNVELPRAQVRDYAVTVMDRFEADDVSVGSAGEEWVYTVGPGSSFGDYSNLEVGGVKLQAVDADTGRAITDLRAVERNTGVVSLSNGEGVCKLLSEKVGDEIDVQIGTGDKRYRTQAVIGTMPDGSMLEVEVAVEPKTQVSNK